MAVRKKKPIHKVVMTEGKRQIVQKLLQEFRSMASRQSCTRIGCRTKF